MAPIPLDWTTTTFRSALIALAQRKVPMVEAEDLVQQVLIEAIASAHRPDDPTSARKWIYGILRNKIADYHRARKTTRASVPPDELPHPAESSEEELSLLRWAMRELPPGLDAQKTLDWLLREGEGEKLEDIAESENVPAPQVRQRVSRLRRYFRERWLAQLAAAALAIVVGVWLLTRKKPEQMAVTPAPERRVSPPNPPGPQTPHNPEQPQPQPPSLPAQHDSVIEQDVPTQDASTNDVAPRRRGSGLRSTPPSVRSSIGSFGTGS